LKSGLALSFAYLKDKDMFKLYLYVYLLYVRFKQKLISLFKLSIPFTFKSFIMNKPLSSQLNSYN